MAKVDVQDASEDVTTASAPVGVPEPTTVVEQSAEQSNVQPAEQPVEQSVERPRKKLDFRVPKLSRRTVLEVLLVVVVVALALWSWSLYSDKQNLADQLAQVNQNPQIAVEQQTKDLLAKVGQLIQLPKDETPTIAAVSDAAKAKKQSAFFANAENGDKVLMYVKAGQAILYRPSTNKIVLVAPLTFSKATADSSKTTDSTANQQ
jgi:type II secretory pathway pseudopilin PulG